MLSMKNKISKLVGVSTFSLLLSAHLSFADSDNQNWTINFRFVNDVYYETDRYYTNGLKLSFISPYLGQTDNDSFFHSCMRNIDQSLAFLYENDTNRNFLFFIGQEIFTPEDRKRTTVIIDDRPYAGWLYIGAGYNWQHTNTLDSFKVSLGIIGPSSFGEEVQGVIHDLIDDNKFDGWNNQLENEIGFILNYERKYKLLESSLYGFGYDAIGHIGGSLGNVSTFANIGFELRAGINMPTDFGTASWQDSSPDTPSLNDSKKPSVFAAHCFAAIDGRVVARNIFLDGNTFADSHDVEKELFVADISIGLSVTYKKYRLSFAHTYRSKEFMKQVEPHNFGTISFSFLF